MCACISAADQLLDLSTAEAAAAVHQGREMVLIALHVQFGYFFQQTTGWMAIAVETAGEIDGAFMASARGSICGGSAHIYILRIYKAHSWQFCVQSGAPEYSLHIWEFSSVQDSQSA